MANLDFLTRLQANIQSLSSKNNKIIVSDGQFVGEDVTTTDNLVKGTTVSKNKEEALIQKKYEDARLGQLKEDVSDEETEAIVDKYINKIVDDIFNI